jgi:FixJ family two-component response regulator
MPTPSRTVYVIDDDGSVRTAVAGRFPSTKFIVKTFSSANEFLSSPIPEQGACIILDLSLPGSHGFDLENRLFSSGIKMPVIIVSATGDQSMREYARRLGATAFFQKPVDDQALLDAITWAIEGANMCSHEVHRTYEKERNDG